MRRDVIDRQVKLMQSAGLDAILSSSPENFAYVTGFLSPTQQLMQPRKAAGARSRCTRICDRRFRSCGAPPPAWDRSSVRSAADQ